MHAPTEDTDEQPGCGGGARQGCHKLGDTGTAAPQWESRDKNGLVMNLQRFSTHDGPGIRTTVFLKGCSNACAWCHNPESIHPHPELQLFADRCIACGRCVDACTFGVHELRSGKHTMHRERCVVCGRCAEECFAGALEVVGRTMTAGEVLDALLEDEPYYRHSGGGVTYSGGEPVLQRSFLSAMLTLSRSEGVHTAVETAGNYPWDWLEALLPEIDLLMYDLKLMDPQMHARYVGNDGHRSHDNLLRVAKTDTPLIVRTPVISGVNDTVTEIQGMARMIGQFPTLQYYELLPYHGLGDSKRESLCMASAPKFSAPSREKFAALADAARAFVSQVRP